MSPEKILLNRVHWDGGCGAPPETWARGWDDAISHCVRLIEEVFNLSDDDIVDSEEFLRLLENGSLC